MTIWASLKKRLKKKEIRTAGPHLVFKIEITYCNAEVNLETANV